MSIITLLIFLAVIFAIELIYFRIANHYNIIDKPNHRSSHTAVTLRGGGVIFALSLLLYPLYFGFEFVYFLVGLLVIAVISFMDDMKPVSNRVRLLFHLIAVGFMFFQLGLFLFPFYWVLLALFLVIGSINAINFMDGINGLTGLYALTTLCTLLYINNFVINYTNSAFLLTSILSVLVFTFFNYRIKAKCFAGDVGSVTIAFIILFFILQLITKTENFNYLLLLLFYGLDTVTTMFFRALRKENIFEAHRSHFYQYLANERKISHLIVSLVYALVQLSINLVVIFVLPSSIFIVCVSILLSVLLFVVIRFSLEGSSKLLGE